MSSSSGNSGNSISSGSLGKQSHQTENNSLLSQVAHGALYHCCFQVRGYELDGYGHVNNAVYLNYAEHARWQMIQQATGSAEYFVKNGVAPVVGRVEVDYKAPCFLAEWLRVETRLVSYRRKVVQFEHRVLKMPSEEAAKDINQKGILSANILATLVCVNIETKKVCDMPDDFLTHWPLSQNPNDQTRP